MRARLRTYLTRTILGFLVVVAAVSGLFFIAKPEAVHAIRDITSIGWLFARADQEILLPTPYGRYYHDLYFQHFDELRRILNEHPAYRAEMENLMRVYAPHVEAMVEGRGSEIRITQEQVDELQTFAEHVQAVANDSLRADIERELQRTPLQDFVGLNMDEALDYIAAAWERDFP